MARRTLLVVEDDDDLRRLYRTSLSFAGFDVIEAGDGLSALRQLDAVLPDIIVLDLMLPQVSGHGILYELKLHVHTRQTPVVIVTGTDDTVTGENVVCILRKPVAPEELVRCVEHCVSAWRNSGRVCKDDERDHSLM